MPPFQTKPKTKKAVMTKTAVVPSSSFKPEERVSATSGGGEPSAPQLQNKQDSISDEMPGENPDKQEGDYHGQGDYSSKGEKQPILDYTPCSWMAQQLAGSGEPLPQGALAQTMEGEQLVSVSICHGCEFEGGCYGFTPEQDENRLINKQPMLKSGGISTDMPEGLVAEKIARMKLGEDTALHLLTSKGFSSRAAAGIWRLADAM